MTTTLKLVDGDFVLNPATGRFVTVSDRQKLSQDLVGAIFTAAPQGADLDTVVGLLGSRTAVYLAVYNRLQESITRMMMLQNSFHADQRPPEERIVGITSFDLQARPAGNEQSKTDYVFRMNVTTAAGTASTVTGVIG